jgi:hypothetical protein
MEDDCLFLKAKDAHSKTLSVKRHTKTCCVWRKLSKYAPFALFFRLH